DQTGDLDAAARTYEQAIAQAQAARAPLDEAQARRDYGVSLQAAGRLPEAIEQWTAALALFEDLKAFSQVARLRTDLGSVRRALGQHARALREYEQALMLLSSLDEHDRDTRGLVLANAAVAYAENGDADSADNFFSEAIAIAERSGDQPAEAVRLNNYGWFLLTIGRPRRAIATLERALILCEKLNLQPQTAIVNDNLGLAHDVLAEYPQALERHQRALALIDGERQPHWAAVFRVNTAHTLIALGEHDPAEALLDEALAYARGAPGAGETLIRALVGKSLIAVARGMPDAASSPLEEAIARARQIDLRRALAEALAARSRQRAALGDSAGAAADWEEAARLYARLSMPQARQTPAWLRSL
ncbi:MAG: tetratricopeptide repeat protein, partial [Anaerolinea sp.]|nr:tetratricopeptide repeat protein [Anaerolinea sp.]